MADLNWGHYTFEVHKSHQWLLICQLVGTGRLQYYKRCGLKMLLLCLMVSNVILHQLLPIHTTVDPIRNVEGILQLPNDRTVLSAYQFSTKMVAHIHGHAVTSLEAYGSQHLCIKVKMIFLTYKVHGLDICMPGLTTLISCITPIQAFPLLTVKKNTITIKTCMQ